mmetsp:Transcript_13945/g.40257  ORF Transcript_13945/g.40257 Transcript_13945/m.40257 type:complete len:385 (+) Transcript_13945:84-1238(+)
MRSVGSLGVWCTAPATRVTPQTRAAPIACACCRTLRARQAVRGSLLWHRLHVRPLRRRHEPARLRVPEAGAVGLRRRCRRAVRQPRRPLLQLLHEGPLLQQGVPRDGHPGLRERRRRQRHRGAPRPRCHARPDEHGGDPHGAREGGAGPGGGGGGEEHRPGQGLHGAGADHRRRVWRGQGLRRGQGRAQQSAARRHVERRGQGVADHDARRAAAQGRGLGHGGDRGAGVAVGRVVELQRRRHGAAARRAPRGLPAIIRAVLLFCMVCGRVVTVVGGRDERRRTDIEFKVCLGQGAHVRCVHVGLRCQDLVRANGGLAPLALAFAPDGCRRQSHTFRHLRLHVRVQLLPTVCEGAGLRLPTPALGGEVVAQAVRHEVPRESPRRC